MPLPTFRFKKFSVGQEGAAHPVGTDAVLLGAWADVRGATHFLDIGTGTGVVALMVAQRLGSSAERDHWMGLGVEIHAPSAKLAKENFASSPWAGQLGVLEGPVQELSEKLPACAFDLILSNPPYFSELTTSSNEARNFGRHTASLSPGALLASAARLLAPKGKCCLILPEREGRLFCELAVPQGLYWTRIAIVRSRPGKPVERLLIQLEKTPYAFHQEEFTIYDGIAGLEYSQLFREMTREFYLTA